jgi:hypothetical protein
MGEKIVSLVPQCGTAAPAYCVADDLRAIADSIEAGEWGGVESCVLVLCSEGAVYAAQVGEIRSPVEAVGMLEFAKAGLMADEDE